jgi:hypothetical protein
LKGVTGQLLLLSMIGYEVEGVGFKGGAVEILLSNGITYYFNTDDGCCEIWADGDLPH